MNFIYRHISLIGILLLVIFAGTAAGLYFDLPAKFQKRSPAPTAKQSYVCPMHPDVGLDRPGNCPKCRMALVPAGEAKSGHEACGDNGENHPGCCSSRTQSESAAELNLPPGHPPLNLPPGHPPIHNLRAEPLPSQPAAPAAQTNSSS